MQLLGILLFVAILAILLIVGIYLARNQTNHNRPASALDDLYRSKGFGSVVDANEQIRQNLSMANDQHHSRAKEGKHQPQQQSHHKDEH
jgi:hypothetical protein